jgi:hypothetical protein
MVIIGNYLIFFKKKNPTRWTHLLTRNNKLSTWFKSQISKSKLSKNKNKKEQKDGAETAK